MKDEILTKMVEGLIEGLMGSKYHGKFECKIEGLHIDDHANTVTVENIILNTKFSQNEGEDDNRSVEKRSR